MSDLDTKLKEHFQRFLKEKLPDYSDPTKADYDETYADEIGTIVGDDKYTEEDVLKWVGSFEGDSFGDLYDKAPTVKNYSYDEDGEEVEDDEVYYKTMDAASEFWNKQLDDYFNNSDTQLKEHFQRFLKDYQ